MVPANLAQRQGQGQVSADNINTFVQTCTTAAQLRTFIGLSNMTVFLLGIMAPNDGLGGVFYWNASGVAPDDNLNVIQPIGVTEGEWQRDGFGGGGLGTEVVFNSDINFRFDGGGSVLTTGVLGDGRVSWAGTINSWTLIPAQTGSMVLDIWKAPFVANAWPTVTNSITGTAPPTIAAGGSTQGTPNGTWTTTVSAGDCFRFNLNSVATITRFTLTLSVTRTVSVT